MPDLFHKVADSALYQTRPIILLYDLNAGGETRFYFLDSLLYAIDYLLGVFAITHDYDTADHLTVAVLLGDAPPYVRTQPHLRYIPDGYGCPVHHLQRNVSNIRQSLQVASTSNDELALGNFDQAATNIAIRTR